MKYSRLESCIAQIKDNCQKELAELQWKQEYYHAHMGVYGKNIAKEIKNAEKGINEVNERYGWGYLQHLAEAYLQQIQETGYGTSPLHRTALQQQIVEEVTTKTRKYIFSLASVLLGEKSSKKRGNTLGRKYISLSRMRKTVDIEDLVQEASAVIAEKFHQYAPSKGKLTTWMTSWALGRMMRYGYLCTPIYLPEGMFKKAKKTLQGKEGREKLELLLEKGRYNEKEVPSSFKAAAISMALNGRYVNIWEPSSGYQQGEGAESYERRYLADEKPTAEELISDAEEKRELSARVTEAMKTMTAREKAIFVNRYLSHVEDRKKQKEIGKLLDISKQMVQQIEAKAVKKFRENF